MLTGILLFLLSCSKEEVRPLLNPQTELGDSSWASSVVCVILFVSKNFDTPEYSFSKTAGFTGLRCAYMVVPKALKATTASL